MAKKQFSKFFEQWEITKFWYGKPDTDIALQEYNGSEIMKWNGINKHGEQSLQHYSIVISKERHNRGDTVLVVPISTIRDRNRQLNDFTMELPKNSMHFIKNDSFVALTQIRALNKKRCVYRLKVHLPKPYQNKLLEVMEGMFWWDND